MTARTRLGARLTALMIVVAAVPLAIAAFLVDSQQSRQLERTSLASLDAIANLQEEHVLDILGAAEDAARLVASTAGYRDRLDAHLQGDTGALAEASSILADAQDNMPGLLNAFVADLDGTLLAGTDPSRVGEVWPVTADIDPTVPDAVSIASAGDSEELVLRLVVPSTSDDSPFLLTAVEIDGQPLVDVAGAHDGLGETGETLLARQADDGTVEFMTPLRFADELDSAVVADERLPVHAALAGEEGMFGSAVDYRGIDVVAATRSIDGTEWGLVVKEDRAAILAPVGEFRRMLLLSASLGVILAGILALLVTPSITRPIRELRRAAAAVAGGDIKARAQIDRADELGELASWVNKMTDQITSANEGLEEEVRRQTVELRATNGALRTFAQAVAHDLRGPAAAIKNLSELAERRDLPDQRRHDVLEMIVTSASRQIQLIDDLLADAETARGLMEQSPEAFAAWLSSTMEIELAVHEASMEIQASGSSVDNVVLLNRVAINLVGNAIKYAANPDGTRIRVTLHSSHDQTKLVVEDNGPGVPEDEREHIFERGVRLHDDLVGNGIGLGDVREALEAVGGEIAADDSPTLGGARFWAVIPSIQQTRQPDEQAERPMARV